MAERRADLDRERDLSIQGTILGALIITILSNGMNIIGLDPYFQNIVKGLGPILSVFVTIDRKKIGIIK